MTVSDAHVCVSWLSHTNTNTTFFLKPPTIFLTYFSRGERRKYAGEKVRLNQVSNSQPPSHESDTLALREKEKLFVTSNFPFFSQCFLPYIAFFFHFKYTLKCRLQFVKIWTSLKFCRLVMS